MLSARSFLLGSLSSILALLAYRRRRRRNFLLGRLHNLAGYSARTIAACRACETELGEDALVQDPLAKYMAGSKALKQARVVLCKTPTNHNRESNEPRTVTKVILRTIFFDDTVMAFTSGKTEYLHTAGMRDLWQQCAQQTCTQVVLLGAGMDTRAWRLCLPAGVAWFEIDQADVLEAKKQLLNGTGLASFQAVPTKSVKYPLKAASYADVPADLQVAGWSQKLLAAGFSTTQRTLWVLEGLLYYLEQDTVPPLLQEMHDVSAPGSIMIASAVSRSVTDRVQGKGNSAMSSWKWGAPGTTDEWWPYFAASGWNTTSIRNWRELSEEYGLRSVTSADAAAKTNAVNSTAADRPLNVGNHDGSIAVNNIGSDSSLEKAPPIKQSGYLLAIRV